MSSKDNGRWRDETVADGWDVVTLKWRTGIRIQEHFWSHRVLDNDDDNNDDGNDDDNDDESSSK